MVTMMLAVISLKQCMLITFCLLYTSMMAQLAVLLDASSRVFAGDVGSKFMPKWLTKKNKNGRPIHSYTFTVGLSLFLLLLTGTLPNINTIYNWLLNVNGIISPYKTCWVFFAFVAMRMHQDKMCIRDR